MLSALAVRRIMNRCENRLSYNSLYSNLATRHGVPPSRLSLFNRMVGFCRGAACYALRRKAHNESMQKVVLCFDTPS